MASASDSGSVEGAGELVAASRLCQRLSISPKSLPYRAASSFKSTGGSLVKTVATNELTRRGPSFLSRNLSASSRALALAAKLVSGRAAKANQGTKIEFEFLLQPSKLDIHRRTTPESSFCLRAKGSILESSLSFCASQAANK